MNTWKPNKSVQNAFRRLRHEIEVILSIEWILMMAPYPRSHLPDVQEEKIRSYKQYHG